MTDSIDKKLIKEFCPRFGQIAVDLGFINPEQLKKAMTEQINDDVSKKPHRVIGTIFFERGWMTYQQIEQVLNRLFKDKMGEEK